MGVGYQATFGEHWSLTGSVGVEPGRTQRNDSFRPGSRSLQGMGDIKATATGGLASSMRSTAATYRSARAMRWVVTTMARRRTCRRVSRCGSLATTVDVTAAAHYGSREYNQTYFGVTELQSERSGFARSRGGAASTQPPPAPPGRTHG